MNFKRKKISMVLIAMMALVGVSLALTGTAKDTGGWLDLFDGTTLSGWEQRNGTAHYSISDSAVVGRTTDGSPNSFLCTKKKYGDFELEFDVMCDPKLNSGVQIRSSAKDGTGPAVYRDMCMERPRVGDGLPPKRIANATNILMTNPGIIIESSPRGPRLKPGLTVIR